GEQPRFCVCSCEGLGSCVVKDQREYIGSVEAIVRACNAGCRVFFFFSSRRRHTRSVSAFLLNRSSDLRRRLRSFAASWLLNALLRIFAMSIITPKRKVLRMSVQDCWRPPL